MKVEVNTKEKKGHISDYREKHSHTNVPPEYLTEGPKKYNREKESFQQKVLDQGSA